MCVWEVQEIKEKRIKHYVLNIVKNIPKHELAFLAVTASIFLPFMITCTAVVVYAIFLVCNKSVIKSISKQKGVVFLAVLSVLIIVVPIFYGRWISVLAGVLFIMVLVYFVYAQSIMTHRLYDKALTICCAMSIVCFFYALMQKLILGMSFRSTAGLLNANYYATIIEFVILICVYRIMTDYKKNKFYIIIIAINIAGLFLSDCQSSWLSIIAGVLLLLFFNGYKRQATIFLAISFLLVILGLSIPGILPRLDRMPQTFSTRINIWTTAWQGIKAHPLFGQGTLTYLFSHELYGGYKTYHAHSLYLDPILSYGIVGVTALLCYITTLIRQTVKNKCPKSSPAKVLMLSVCAAVCVHGITDFSILWVQTGMLLCFIMSYSGIKGKSDKETKNIC